MALSLEDCDAMIEAAHRNKTALVVGHTHGFNPAIKTIRQIIDGGEVGRISMMALWNYTDFLYRPRRPEELDTSAGGGILFNQIPHQIDIVRTLNPNDVLTVRASTAVLDPARPTEGSCTALLTFANGGSASIVYSGYDRFDSDELHDWVGELGQPGGVFGVAPGGPGFVQHVFLAAFELDHLEQPGDRLEAVKGA